jgi:ABC-type glycerol-3-phosphate transport system substrate-binding protein
MKKILKRMMALGLSTIAAATVLAGCGGATGDSGIKIDENKTQLYVASYQGGVGRKWLDNVIARFEEQYQNVPFEDGKMGVQIVPSVDKKYIGSQLVDTIKTDDNDVYFTQEIDYFTFASRGLVLDLTDFIKTTANQNDNKTIYSKLSSDDQETLAVDGKYYAIPHYELYPGLSYDAGIFEREKLYFSDEIEADGTRKFIVNNKTKKSCGPDGEYETYDDGLPSSMMELHKLVDKMKGRTVQSFIWTGSYVYYTTMLVQALYQSYLGANGVRVGLDFDSNGEEIEIVKKVNSDGTIETENVVITRDNAYLLKETAALYYALQFASKIFKSTDYYYPGCTSGSFSHTAAQEYFMNSGLNGKPNVAMLIEGNYWYNEARDYDVFKDLETYYPETYTDKDVKFMPLPQRYDGTVTEGNGGSPVLVDTYSAFAFVNKNIDSSKIELAKMFLSFCYSDNELVEFTKTTGTIKGVEYDYAAATSSVSDFEKSVIEIRTAAKNGNSFVRYISNDPIYRQNRSVLNIANTSEFWASTVGGVKEHYFYNAVKANGVDYKDYFKGMAIGKNNWNASFNTTENN